MSGLDSMDDVMSLTQRLKGTDEADGVMHASASPEPPVAEDIVPDDELLRLCYRVHEDPAGATCEDV